MTSMSHDDSFEDFMQHILARPMPSNPLAQAKTLARELAEGVIARFWEFEIENVTEETYPNGVTNVFLGTYPVPEIREYLEQRWPNLTPTGGLIWNLLETKGYIQRIQNGFKLTNEALKLVEDTEDTNIFISYSRKDSSAFALLILKYLKEHELNAFVDKALIPGEDWHAGLQERIQEAEYFILILGKQTLLSKYVLKELDWALDAELTIIPIWHNGFSYKLDQWELPLETKQLLQNTHTIRVLEESASGYEKALIELLNRFGITP